MSNTVRLFDQDPYIKDFSARVVSCEPISEGGYAVVLDQTAFFPEEGGQACDGGEISQICVQGVTEKDGVIIHVLPSPVCVGAEVECHISFAERYRKMQNHTGEHIISAIIHRKFGYNNVGFHLGADDVTADFDGELNDGQIELIETLANEAIYACRNVRAYYPTKNELSELEYRSKLELDSDVRIVEIDGIDKCACCAPHVKNTGEIGMIKILDHIRYKGGVRIHMQCGFDALDDYRARYAEIRKISMLISAKQDEVSSGVERLLDEIGKMRGEISSLKREMLSLKLSSLAHTDSSLCLFESIDDMLIIRGFVNDALSLTEKICAVFTGNDADGYKFIAASRNIALRSLTGRINEALNAKCGGSDKMIQGTAMTSRACIEKFFASLDENE